jgi:hypothetical protein
MAEDSAERETDTFRFDPDEFHAEDEHSAESEDPDPDRHGEKPRGDDREFGNRGWALVVALFFAFGVIPMTIFFLPRAQGVLTAIGLGYRDAFLVLPLVPALVLGAMAVWATTRP